ncbi:class I histocompatibility antigen, F10 alpha chain-like isoform X2 [Erpetoichthys calabaricus]|uniref:class I histocompatibility antigen, F10 alpha chain-like isoform X2 n=1 Tax=Erpetoichthys calabaricus TaxID=27687 RepID=UPI0022341BB1|nr:class I histocompatibility antigen, F10 alpha chain-like isoform X2 [Erpetoichthys calabaricus]
MMSWGSKRIFCSTFRATGCIQEESLLNFSSVERVTVYTMISFILLLFVDLTLAETQSLKYFYTGSSGVTEFPEFVVVGLVNDEQFVYFDNNINRMIPRQEWMAKSEGPSYWDGQTQALIGSAQNFKANLGTLKERFNQTEGIHTWQMMYGCELDDDGTTRGFHQFGYDGDDYVSFDKQTLTWTAANPRGETTKMRWDPNKALNLQTKGYLEGTCIEWLKKYVVYGAATLERKVHPEVFLTHKRTDSGMEATCYVTGFFPRDIEVMWQNGGARDLDIESGEVLPNEDGTYQVKKTLKLKKKPEELKKGDYSCRVAHSSLTGNGYKTIQLDPAMKNPNEPSGSFPVWIIAVVVGILLAVTAGAGVFIWMKKKNSGGKNPKYIQAEKNSSSDSSNEDISNKHEEMSEDIAGEKKNCIS